MMRRQQRLEAQFVDIEEEGSGFDSFKDIDYTLDQDANEVLDEEDEVSRGKLLVRCLALWWILTANVVHRARL